MSPKLQIEYKSMPPLVFPSSRSLKSHLENEKAAYSEFLGQLNKKYENSNSGLSIQNGRRNFSWASIGNGFDLMLARADDPQKLAEIQNLYQENFARFPPSSSVQGQLIISMCEAGNQRLAESAFLHFLNLEHGVSRNNNHSSIAEMIATGENISLAASVVATLPFGKVSGQKLGALIKAASGAVQEISDHVVSAEEDRSKIVSEGQRLHDRIKIRARRISSAIIDQEHRRRDHFNKWIGDTQIQVDDEFQSANRRLESMERLTRSKVKNWEDKFQDLYDRYNSLLKLKTPVELWGKRQAQHRKSSRWALLSFVTLSGLVAAAAVATPLKYGQKIADSFIPACESGHDNCPPFSAEGPLLISAILIAFSVALWMVRLVYRVYLSERHLSLDASEKKAFAETYLAMKDDEKIDRESEAIVLASLFRPTQDGIIKDDERGIDLSAAALIAKQLGKP